MAATEATGVGAARRTTGCAAPASGLRAGGSPGGVGAEAAGFWATRPAGGRGNGPLDRCPLGAPLSGGGFMSGQGRSVPPLWHRSQGCVRAGGRGGGGAQRPVEVEGQKVARGQGPPGLLSIFCRSTFSGAKRPPPPLCPAPILNKFLTSPVPAPDAPRLHSAADPVATTRV